MVAHDSEEPTSTVASRDLAIGDVARARKPMIARVRTLIFWGSVLAAAAVLAGVAYWSYRLLQPRPLFAQTASTLKTGNHPTPAPKADG